METLQNTSRVLVTGGSGFVGRWLIERILSRYPGVSLLFTGTSLATDAFASQQVVDILDSQATADLIRDFQPELVIHLAAQANVATSFDSPELTWAVNLNGTLNLLRALQQHAPQATLLNVSSSDIYGASFKRGIALDEEALLQPLNPYAASKAAAELACFSTASTSNLHILRARPFNHSGPGQAAGYVLPSFAQQIAQAELKEDAVLRVGNLNTYRDFLDVSDVVNAYIAILENASAFTSGEAINIASGHSIQIRAALQQMAGYARNEPKIEQDPARMRASDIPVAAGNADKLRSRTGWRPETDVMTGTLPALLDYARQQLAGH